MYKNRFFLGVIILSMICTQSFAILTVDKLLWYGIIQFPPELKSVEPIRVYYTGGKIPYTGPLAATVNPDKHQVSYTISEYKARNTFYLVITDRPDFAAKHNTIHYLRVPEGRPYKLYELTFTPNKETITNQQDIDISQRGSWEIVQKRLAEDLRIPDNAIVVCYHAHLVKSVEGGNAIELPRILLNGDIMKNLSSEELHDVSIQFLLSSLNCDSFHISPDTQIKSADTKTILALTT